MIYVGIVVGAGLLFIGVNYMIGWVIGWSVMLILEKMRTKFYKNIMETTTFNLKNYIGYNLLVIGLIVLPVIGAFYSNHYVSPYTIMAAYLLYRFVWFVRGIFGDKHVSN